MNTVRCIFPVISTMIYFLRFIFTISFTLQNIQYADVIPDIVCCKKSCFFLNRRKWMLQIKRLDIFPPFRTFSDMWKKTRIYGIYPVTNREIRFLVIQCILWIFTWCLHASNNDIIWYCASTYIRVREFLRGSREPRLPKWMYFSPWSSL